MNRRFALFSFLISASVFQVQANPISKKLSQAFSNCSYTEVLPQPENRLKNGSVQYPGHLPDSSIGFRWDSLSAQWEQHHKAIFEYTANGCVYQYTGYLWNKSSQTWMPNQRENYRYEGSNQPTVFETAFWNTDSADWILDKKFLYTYNQELQLTSKLKLSWEQQEGWKTEWKEDFYYTEKGNLTSWSYSIFQNGTWINLKNETSSINSFGNATDWVYKIKDTVSNHWLNVVKHFYQYNSEQQLTQSIETLWDTTVNGWQQNHKISYSYNSIDSLESFQIYSFDKSENQFVLASKTEYLYDESVQISSTAYSWDIAEEIWHTSYYSELTYDEMGNITQELEYGWALDLQLWKGYKNIQTSYNSAGQRKTERFFKYQIIDSTWVDDYKKEYYYPRSIIKTAHSSNLNSGFDCYPNPARDYITITHTEKSPIQLLIYNSNGVEQYTGSIRQSETLNTQDWTSGVYILQIQSKAGNQQKCLIIEH